MNELFINFATGDIDGNCSGCNAAQVADALMTIAAALQVMDDTPNYIDYDEGKVFLG